VIDLERAKSDLLRSARLLAAVMNPVSRVRYGFSPRWVPPARQRQRRRKRQKTRLQWRRSKRCTDVIDLERAKSDLLRSARLLAAVMNPVSRVRLCDDSTLGSSGSTTTTATEEAEDSLTVEAIEALHTFTYASSERSPTCSEVPDSWQR
jgi:hypothetical protein